MEELRALQKKREELRVKLKEAEARYDLAMVADLRRAPAAAAKRGAGEGGRLATALAGVGGGPLLSEGRVPIRRCRCCSCKHGIPT